MKNALLSLQVVFMLAFLSSFITSYFVMDSMKEKSREVVTQKVSSGLLSTIVVAEEFLHSPKVKALLADHHIEVINREIGEFKEKPVEYISQMTNSETEVDPVPVDLRSESKLKNALLAKVFAWKLNIKDHFQATFEALVFDVRLFLLSNVFGLLIAALINWHRENLGKHAVVVSLVLTSAIFLSAFSYINANWLYSILLNSYAGFAYPAGVVVTACWLFWEYWKYRSTDRDVA